MSLFAELKRRNVIRVAIAYLIAAWLVLQVSELVLETIEAPAWVLKVFLLIFGLGLPIVLLFSWAYELTPEGIKREKDVDRSMSVTPDTGRKLNQITIAMIISLVAFIAVDKMYFAGSAQPQTETTAAVSADKSIAVLAFEDLSPDGDQEYFADGLSEELLNVLAQIPDLQVAGRTSSFAFKGQNRDLREIGEILNVAHILEGSVRKSGNRIRVTAQLINAVDGFHLFSESYDRDLTDVFAVQDEIAAAISGALRTEIIGTQTQQVAETSIEAYDLYLVARQKLYDRDKAEMEEALTLLDQAIEIDSEYAPALAQKALALILLSDGIGSYGDIPEAEAAVAARELVDRALALDDGLAEAHAISALIMESEESATWDEMIEIYEYALRLNPNLDNARLWLASAYGYAGRNDESRALNESIIEHDPLFGVAFNNLIGEYLRTNDLDLANALIGRYERAAGETADVYQSWADIAFVKGEIATSVRHHRRVFEESPSNTINLFWYAEALGTIGEFEAVIQIARPNQKITALGLLGRHDEARELLATMTPKSDLQSDLSSALSYFVRAGQYDEAVSYAEQHFGDLDTLIEHFASPVGQNSFYMAPLAFSYLQVDRTEEFQQLTKAMAEATEMARADKTDNLDLWLFEAMLAGMTGSDEEVLKQAQKIVDNGGVSVQLFTSPIFDRMKDNPEFQKLRALVLKRTNDERAKLGLDPYLPITGNI
jgi:TolB-like protein